MTIFQQVKTVPADPILGLLETFRADSRTDKVNLTVGVYQDDHGRTPILETVRWAEERLFESETTKDYISMSGDPALARLIPDLLWPAEISEGRPAAIVTFQTIGGSGALRVVADFVRCEAPATTIWISEPTWPNHPGIFASCGLSVSKYRYYDAESSSIDITGLLDDLSRAHAGDVVVVHGCCHNPTGADLKEAQWEALGQVIQKRGLLPVVDLAYQGFAAGITQDAAAIRRLAQNNGELFACISFSKTFGLYRERAGALVAVGTDQKTMDAVASRLRICVRTNYSNPPAHGGAIVAMILADPALRSCWEAEVARMRQRLVEARADLVGALQHVQSRRDFSFLGKQSGMFAMTGLTREQVARLRDEYAIYLVDNGRMNVAGLNRQNLERVAESITAVL